MDKKMLFSCPFYFFTWKSILFFLNSKREGGVGDVSVWGCVKMPQTRHECLEEEYDNVMKMRNSIGKCQTDTATMSRTQKPRQNKEFFLFLSICVTENIATLKSSCLCFSGATLESQFASIFLYHFCRLFFPLQDSHRQNLFFHVSSCI